MRFGTPEAAVEVLLTAFKNSDDGTLSALFGAEYADRLLSKDKVAAREDRTRLYQAAQKTWTLRKDTADRAVLVIGPDAWPFPIPLVRSGADWRFHTAEGVEEIVNRRIGRNELNAISGLPRSTSRRSASTPARSGIRAACGSSPSGS